MRICKRGRMVPLLRQFGINTRRIGGGSLSLDDDAVLPDKKILPFLQLIWERYGQFSPKKLEQMTHNDGPWKDVRGGRPQEARCTDAIPKQRIRDYYAKKINKNWNGWSRFRDTRLWGRARCCNSFSRGWVTKALFGTVCVCQFEILQKELWVLLRLAVSWIKEIFLNYRENQRV